MMVKEQDCFKNLNKGKLQEIISLIMKFEIIVNTNLSKDSL